MVVISLSLSLSLSLAPRNKKKRKLTPELAETLDWRSARQRRVLRHPIPQRQLGLPDPLWPVFCHSGLCSLRRVAHPGIPALARHAGPS